MNQRSHKLDSVNQAWSGTMKQAALESEHAPFADSRKFPPWRVIAEAYPLIRSPALRETTGQQEDDFRRFSSQSVDFDAGRRLSFASQARISTSQPHLRRDQCTGGHARIKRGQT